ncbi:putative zinc metalloprotease [Aspergillus ellipticus CBS 707.79]|uniref:Peptide hydrolase n=1 Tax=Aspergillus ellipticus CBS 707.79 TaxID=1448320 RepID=A0A319DK64_9EURO|nr:putative zinc metalloprotease [Aspergillus ellipticus CBS 707.79]
MAPARLSRANPLGFTRWPVTLITTAVYLAFLIPLLIVHHVVPSPPSSNPTGLDLAEAWADLQVLTAGFHPYNSRRNDEVHRWLLQRIDEILTSTPAPASYAPFREKKPSVFVFDDTTSNLTFVSNPLKATNTAVYFEGTNILVYVRGQDDSPDQWWTEPNGVPPAGQSGGVLVNAHYDSVSTGYGATDDGVGVVSCLQLIKYFTTPGHVPRKGLVVLFNNGEEDFLNGARVYGQHPLAKLPHTFVNLEGAGAGGRAILFRSSDTEVTKSYMRSKYPFGSILAANGFEVGLITSQTDYVVFEHDLGLRGLDVAFMEPRSRYHTEQDDSRHTSPGSLWHMLSAAVATTEGLVQDGTGQFDGALREDERVASGEGSKGVWFDLFGTTFVVFQLHTLFALSVTLLIVAPLVLLVTGTALTRADRMYLFRTSAKGEEGSEVTVSLQGLRGFFRFPFLFAIPTAVTVGLAYLVTKVNPLIIHSSEYAVWSMMLSAWTFLAWFVSRVADFARPSALHRVYTLTWIFVVGWVLLVIATVYENKWGLAGGYFVFFFFSGVFVATWIAYLELFSLPRKSEYAQQCAPVSRRASSYGGSRLGTASGEEHEEESHDAEEEEEPTESTSLLGGGQRTTFANYVRVAGDNHHHPADSDIDEHYPNVYKHEQRWSAPLPKWTWVLQFLLIAPLVLIMVGPLSLLLTSALHQTGQDGSSSLFVYIALAALSTFLLTPLLPFIHRHTYHIPIFLLLVFLGTLIYNLVAFPFSPSNRLKLFFVQEIDLSSGENTVSLSGAYPFVLDAASTLPSTAGQNITCIDHVVRGTKCSWPGLAPRVVEDPNTPVSDWLDYTITKSSTGGGKGEEEEEEEGKPKSARFTLSGRNTRACKLLFDSPVSSFSVLGSASDSRFPTSSPVGTKEIRLWSREWENEWVVDVAWTESPNAGDDAEDKKSKKGSLTGNVVCLWSDANSVGAIPALDEIKQFGPVWVAATKAADGLVEGRKSFSV